MYQKEKEYIYDYKQYKVYNNNDIYILQTSIPKLSNSSRQPSIKGIKFNDLQIPRAVSLYSGELGNWVKQVANKKEENTKDLCIVSNFKGVFSVTANIYVIHFFFK